MFVIRYFNLFNHRTHLFNTSHSRSTSKTLILQVINLQNDIMNQPTISITTALHHAQLVISKSHFNSCSYRAHFGVSPSVFAKSWELINRIDVIPGIEPKHLCWAFLFLKVYSTEEIHSSLVKTNRNTFRKWAWTVIRKLSQIKTV